MVDLQPSNVAIMSANPVATSATNTSTLQSAPIHEVHTIIDESDSDNASEYMSVKSDDDENTRKKQKLDDPLPSRHQQPLCSNTTETSLPEKSLFTNSSLQLNQVPSFKFGPYIPILRKQDEIVIDPNGIVDCYSLNNETQIAKRLAYEILPDDSIVDAPSLVTPLLLKKNTVWPPRSVSNENVQSENAEHNFRPIDVNLENSEDSEIQVIKIVKKTPQNPIQNEVESSNAKDIETYIKSTAVASLITAKHSSKPILTIQDYYKTSAAETLYNIGMSQVTEFNLADKIKKLSSKIRRCREKEDCKLQIEELEESRKQRELIKVFNKPYRAVRSYRCHHCLFKSESLQVYDSHLETLHVVRKDYLCNWCDFKSKDINQTAFHNLVQHKKRCRLEKPLPIHLCHFCSYECSSKRRITAHLTRCEQFFSSSTLQGPQDFEEDGFPGITSKLITHEDIIAYEKNLRNLRLAAYNPHQISVSGIKPASVNQVPILVVARSPAPSTSNASITPLNPFECFVQKTKTITRTNANGQVVKNPIEISIDQLRGSQMRIINHNTGPNTSIQLLNVLSADHGPTSQNSSATLQSPRTQSPFINGKAVLKNATEIVMSPPTPSQTHKQDTQTINLEEDEDNLDDTCSSEDHAASSDSPKGSTFVICEICDGYITDLSQLKIHMQWIHKVRLHQKMLASKPPLNCQKCQWRFFTDQGLERHLLGAHGLVTSNMQEQVDRGADSGRCTVCGRAFASSLVAHMKDIHRSSLKPAHLSYKCTVCSATFNLYRLFENHVYSVHSDSVRRVSSK